MSVCIAPRQRTAFQKFVSLAVLSSACFAQGPSGLQALGPVKLTKDRDLWVKQTLKGLTLDEKVGQMLQIRYFGDYEDFDGFAYRHLREELQKYHIGSVVFGMHFSNTGPLRIIPLDAAKVANQMQRDSKLPLLLAADVERGVASRLSHVPSFPWPMAFGAADNPKQVERFAAITAREARAIGIQWALAPVADVNSNPANPVINTRSFGENPEKVATLVAAFIRGAHENGLLVTAKHFPGNGDTSVNSHNAVASIDGDYAHLQRIEFPPFKSAIAAGVDSIMLAHAKVPSLEPDPEKITTISSRVVGVLRVQLGFKGVVLTDALEMRGLTQLYDPRKGSPTALAAVDAVKAGNDVIMLPTDLDGAFHAIVNAVRSGQIPESRIDESVRKILEMKASVGLNESRFVDLKQVSALTGKPEDLDFAQSVADEAVTLVRDNRKVLPLQGHDFSYSRPGLQSDGSQKHRLLVIVLAEFLESTNGRELEKEVKARRPDAEVFYFDGRFSSPAIPEILKAADLAESVVIATYVVHEAAAKIRVDGNLVQSFGMLGPAGQLLQQVLDIASEKAVVVALGSPYLIESYIQIQNYVCTYAMSPTSEVSAVKAIFGETQTHGKLPVTLPDVAQRGESLPWPTRQPYPNGQIGSPTTK